MTQKKGNLPKKVEKDKKGSETNRAAEVIFLVVMLVLVFIFVSLCSYSPYFFADKSVKIRNFFTGSFGLDYVAHPLANLFGIVAFYIPLMLLFVLVAMIKKNWRYFLKHLALNLVNFLVLLPVVAAFSDTYKLNNTNLAGNRIYRFLEAYIGIPGFVMLVVAWFLTFLILTLHLSIKGLFGALGNEVKEHIDTLKHMATEPEPKPEEQGSYEPEHTVVPKLPEEPEEPNEPDVAQETVPEELEPNQVTEFTEPEYEPEPEKEPEQEIEPALAEIEPENEPEPAPEPAEPGVRTEPESRHTEPVVKPEQDEQPQQLKNIDIVTALADDSGRDKKQLESQKNHKDYKLPPFELLENPEESLESTSEREKEAQTIAATIQRKLLSHGIKVTVAGVTRGPVVTMYEVELGDGVKVSQVAALETDLAVAVGGKKVRVVPYIEGKPCIGIEVPNRERLTIRLRRIISSDAFEKISQKGLPIALGLDVKGESRVALLNKMPHMLVAGTTGSGKSVGINSFIVSLLYTLTPEEVKFIMIDPKGNEFNIYEGIPHMLLPVVVDSKKAAKALQWAVVEMDHRFRILAENTVRDIDSYNKKVDALNEKLKDDPNGGFKKMPYIVIVIDEFADLMMVAGKDVEIAVARIAQKARAVGIHLIVATQKPTKDVVTGLIKSNLPVRMAFKVASNMDSRVILDTPGAETLLGNGDMLFIPPGTSTPQRVHGAFVSVEEIRAVIDFIKTEVGEIEPEDILDSFQVEGEGSEEGGDDDKDELYDEMLAFIRENGKCSASMLQRRFKIGYNRAARAVELFEKQGIVSSGDGAKPRDVIG
ncbi:DNA translocase FtsK [bacterium]|nr:DNA translocase FtsK [bacterium]